MYILVNYYKANTLGTNIHQSSEICTWPAISEVPPCPTSLAQTPLHPPKGDHCSDCTAITFLCLFMVLSPKQACLVPVTYFCPVFHLICLSSLCKPTDFIYVPFFFI